MRNIVIGLAVLALTTGAQAQLKHFLVAQWRANTNQMCKYDDGTVVNMGYKICPLSIGGPENEPGNTDGYTGGYTSGQRAWEQGKNLEAQTKALEAQRRALEAQTKAQQEEHRAKKDAQTEPLQQGNPQNTRPDGISSPSTTDQQVFIDQWARWLKQCTDFCATDERCEEMCATTAANSLGCAAGVRTACNERARDLAEIERYNAQKRNSSSFASKPGAGSHNSARQDQPIPSVAAQTTLFCKVVLVGGTRIDGNFVVDFDKKTVNGRSATITDNMIQFDMATDSMTTTTTINRLSGSIMTWSDSAKKQVGTGDCIKATQRQF